MMTGTVNHPTSQLEPNQVRNMVGFTIFYPLRMLHMCRNSAKKISLTHSHFMPSQTEVALQIIIIRHFDRLGCKFSFMLHFYLSVKYGNACYLECHHLKNCCDKSSFSLKPVWVLWLHNRQVTLFITVNVSNFNRKKYTKTLLYKPVSWQPACYLIIYCR